MRNKKIKSVFFIVSALIISFTATQNSSHCMRKRNDKRNDINNTSKNNNRDYKNRMGKQQRPDYEKIICETYRKCIDCGITGCFMCAVGAAIYAMQYEMHNDKLKN